MLGALGGLVGLDGGPRPEPRSSEVGTVYTLMGLALAVRKTHARDDGLKSSNDRTRANQSKSLRRRRIPFP